MGDLDLRFYASIFFRRLPLFLAVAIPVATLGLAVAFMLPKIYQASAKILVEAPQISADLARPTVQTNAYQQLQVIEQQITTRENLVALAQRLGVYGGEFAKLAEADIVEDMRERMTFEELQQDGYGGQGARMFSVSFEGRDSRIAADVVNEVTEIILQRNESLRNDQARETLQFFQDEVARLGTELSVIEARILEFKNTNRDALPDSLDFRRTQQSTLQERMAALEREEAALRGRRNNLVELFEATGVIANAAPLTAEQQLLQDLKRTLSDQLVLFSETSPNITSLRARIAALEESVRSSNSADEDRLQKTKPPSELDLQLSDIDQRLAFITREKETIGKSLAKLTASVSATPANETVLNSLERDRLNLQNQYNVATARLAEASTGKQIEAGSKGERFTVIEPAIPPQDPIKSNRRRVAAAGAAMGGGLGLGLIFLLELLNKRVRRPAEIVQMFDAQPLATIPYISLPDEKRRSYLRPGLLFGAGAIPAALALLALSHASVGQFVQKIAARLGEGRIM
ncbi:Wzz/FepE/Etk N-terminal domain-containing protein [Aquamicrobium sp. LC103]|uniref:GumC family protein n=1 Tax=Aquamicrobium sp. LC103 TaxID=1120658 RepID=UPI00063EB7CE|nr:Wzz/FepE/Etk N-terminal domain-containing protein [Aquamicrobium sp. LC103]TKT80279.1 lipopolysaccharide biosynthesis protein [Aquamicrobium sp. LC103]